MIIGINGKIGSGKDTVGKIIQYLTSECGDSNSSRHRTYAEFLKRGGGSNLRNFDQHYVSDWEVKKFAGKLKTTASLLTGIDVEKFEDQEFKKTFLGQEWDYIEYMNNSPRGSITKMTIRELLQKLGTEAMRDGLHTNVWVNALFADYVPISDISKSNTCVDDRLHHGYKGTKIYRTYHNIKQRCNNPKHPRYNDYGNRGITMCEEWLNNITSFINWAIENGYNESLSIDRIDNNKGYSPDNCRCVSYAVQSINKSLRKDNTSGYKGVTKDSHNWRAQIQIKGKQKFLGYFDTAEEASEAYENAFMEREGLYLKEEENNLIYPSWCITDMRFPNELEAVEERKGITIRVVRYKVGDKVYWTDPEGVSSGSYEVTEVYQDFCFINNDFSEAQVLYHEIKLIAADLHPSETALDDAEFDYEIINNGSIEDLIEKMRQVLTIEGII